MSVIHNADVKTLFFVGEGGKRVVQPVTPGTMTRLQAGNKLNELTDGVYQPSFQCGYSVVGGGNVHWFSA